MSSASEARPVEAARPERRSRDWRQALEGFGWFQAVAAAVFVGLSCLLVGLQVKNSFNLARTPGFFGARDGLTYIVIYAIGVASLAGLALVLPRRLLIVPVAIGGLALATAVVAVGVPGREGVGFLVALLTLTGSWWLGRRALSLPGLRRSTLAGSGFASLAVGLFVVGMVVFLLGLVGGIYWWTVGLLVIVAGGLGALRLGSAEARRVSELPRLVESRLRAATLAILGVQAAYATVWAGAPEVQYDSVQYKEWLPALWASSHHIRVSTFVDNPISVYLGLAQLDATPGHTLGGGGTGRYLQLLLTALIVIVVWRLGSRISPALGPIAALVVALTPHVVWQSSTAYGDIFLTALVLGGAMAVYHFEGRRVEHPFWASIAIGLVGGIGVTGKLHLLAFCVGLGVCWCLVASSLRDLARRAGGYLAGAAIGALPLVLYRWIEMDSPVFPFYNGVFKSRFYPVNENITNFGELSAGGTHETWRFLWRLVAQTPLGIETGTAGVTGLLVAGAFVGVFFGWRGPASQRVVWGATVIALLAWWQEFRYVRFGLPYLILAVIVALPALAGLGRAVRGRVADRLAVVFAAVAAVVFFVSTMASFWAVPGRFPLAVAVGRESNVAYLTEALPEYPSFNYLNQVAAPGDWITGQAWGRLLLRPDLNLQIDWEIQVRLLNDGTYTTDPDALATRLEQLGIHWVVLANEGRQYDPTYWLGPMLAKHGQIVYADHLHDVYRIVDRPQARIPVPLCDETFSNPDCWIGSTRLDDTPGITDAEVRSQPVWESVPVCAGATYALTVKSQPGRNRTRIFFVFDVPNQERAFRVDDVPTGRTSVVYQTAPTGATKMDIVVDPLGPTAGLDSMRLAIAKQPDDGSTCS